MMSVIAGALPLHGMCTACNCARTSNDSVIRCAVAPVPDQAKLYLPRLARTSAIRLTGASSLSTS
jgi:hypothetical protein